MGPRPRGGRPARVSWSRPGWRAELALLSRTSRWPLQLGLDGAPVEEEVEQFLGLLARLPGEVGGEDRLEIQRRGQDELPVLAVQVHGGDAVLLAHLNGSPGVAEEAAADDRRGVHKRHPA